MARLLLLSPSLAMMGLLGFGMVSLGYYAFQDGASNLTAVLSRPDYITAVLNTHLLGIETALTCAILGFPVAAYVATHRYRSLLLMAIIAPWLVSVVVRTFGWITLLGRRGVINSMLSSLDLIERPLPLIYNSTGILVGLTHILLPLMILSILAVYTQISRSLPEAAASLGAGPVQSFFQVSLPLSAPGIISGMVLVYLGSVGAVVTPLLLGGVRQRMIGIQIYTDMFTVFDFPKASALAFILVASAVVIVLPVLIFERWLLARLREGGAR